MDLLIDRRARAWHHGQVARAGQLDDAAVKHAIELSQEKYCSVEAMIKKTATVTYRYEIQTTT